MAIPLIAAGIVAKAVAKKLATRAIGGITGAGAKNVAPINRNMNTNSVIKIPPVTKFQQQSVNTYKTQRVNDFKSGAAAQRADKNTKNLDGLPKKPTIKINSNPTRAR